MTRWQPENVAFMRAIFSMDHKSYFSSHCEVHQQVIGVTVILFPLADDVGIFYVHLVNLFYGHLVYFMVVWYIFPRFGALY
jgi:hypothetical protein